LKFWEGLEIFKKNFPTHLTTRINLIMGDFERGLANPISMSENLNEGPISVSKKFQIS